MRLMVAICLKARESAIRLLVLKTYTRKICAVLQVLATCNALHTQVLHRKLSITSRSKLVDGPIKKLACSTIRVLPGGNSRHAYTTRNASIECVHYRWDVCACAYRSICAMWYYCLCWILTVNRKIHLRTNDCGLFKWMEFGDSIA